MPASLLHASSARSRISLAPRPVVAQPDTRLLAINLVHSGAILAASGQEACLVGEFRWNAPHRIAWFPAFGDRLDDARACVFDRTSTEPGAIMFWRGRTRVARLASIDAMEVDDPEDFQIGWQLWLEVVPLRRGFINAAFDALLRPDAGGENPIAG